MTKLHSALVVAAIGVGSVLLPAQKSEAGLVDWVRCVLHPCRWPCSTCSSCETPCSTCPAPVVQEGSYCNPCQPCAVSYVRRTYCEPCTRITTQYALEACPTYVRRHYWDPCSVSYRTSCECSTSYVRRRYCVPVTDYVQRSYLEPVTNCVTPGCPTDCPTTISPTTIDGSTSYPPGASRTVQPLIGAPARSVNPSSFPPGRGAVRPNSPSAQRTEPITVGSLTRAAY